ncbi:transposase [Myxococcus sp. RHSTA-1-4]|uniref:transposase n=1 Tax=Myxococcus sp. RHSTA-1-4 TaxID=2874601 RepID=UPI001CC13214|nr:transposase [Myxococcus sp. RHSTA-1-4]MBZ4416842.1 transposase [Myxococcus sp. RHSTA-1-4]
MAGSRRSRVRVLRPKRTQVLAARTYEQLVDRGHPVRAVWAAVEALDMSDFERAIRARPHHAGRSAVDPRLLLALWVYGQMEGLSSAHAIAARLRTDVAYWWLCVGVGVSAHTLSSFMTRSGPAFRALLGKLLDDLCSRGAVRRPRRVAQDGTRVRASAGAASFHRKATLRKRATEAAAAGQCRRGASTKARAAQKRARADLQARAALALAALPAAARRKKRAKGGVRGEPRASLTDPQAHVMRMPDGGYRPAYNAQAVSDVESRLALAGRVTNEGTDAAQLLPMVHWVARVLGLKPEAWLVDGAYRNLKAFSALESQGIHVFSPLPARKNLLPPGAPSRRQRGEPIDAWRARMQTPAGKRTYAQRAPAAELLNAQVKERQGLRRLHVRGRKRAEAAWLLALVAHNLLLAIAQGWFDEPEGSFLLTP